VDDGIDRVAPPAELIGKWRLEVADGESSRTAVHHFMNDGRVMVDVRLDTPTQKVADRVKRAVVMAEKDRINVIDISRTSENGLETPILPGLRRTHRYQIEVKGDELRLTAIDEEGKAIPGERVSVLKRVKE
jgi:hypothetical protein